MKIVDVELEFIDMICVWRYCEVMTRLWSSFLIKEPRKLLAYTVYKKVFVSKFLYKNFEGIFHYFSMISWNKNLNSHFCQNSPRSTPKPKLKIKSWILVFIFCYRNEWPKISRKKNGIFRLDDDESYRSYSYSYRSRALWKSISPLPLMLASSRPRVTSGGEELSLVRAD